MPRGNSEGYRAVNEFKVPQRVWGSWTLVARHVFNKTYQSMTKNPEFFLHTDQGGTVNPVHFRVTAWNAAFTAASVCSRGERHILKELTQKVRG